MTARFSTSLICVVLAVGALVVFWPDINGPVDGDTGIYAYAADRMLNGEAPYAAVWDIKSPGIFFQYYFAFNLLGNSETGAFLMDTLLAIGCAILLFFIGRRTSSDLTGVFAASAYLLGYQRFAYAGWAGQPETTATLCAAALIFIAIGKGPISWKEALLAGLITGAAMMMKLPFLALALLLLLRFGPENRFRESLKSIPAFVFGSALVLIATLSYFSYHGALTDLYEVGYRAPGMMISAYPSFVSQVSAAFSGAQEALLRMPVIFGLAVLGAMSTSEKMRELRTLAMWLFAAAILIIVAQGRYWPYNWILCLPAVGLLAGIGATWIFQAVSRSLRFGWAISAMLIIAMSVVGAPTLFRAWSAYFTTRAWSSGKEEFWMSHVPEEFKSEAKLASAPLMGRRLLEISSAGDEVYGFNLAGAMNYYASRRSPTRFITHMPLEFEQFAEFDWQSDYERSLIDSPPRFIVVSRSNGGRDDLPVLSSWPTIGAWFRAGYALREAIGPYEIYERN